MPGMARNIVVGLAWRITVPGILDGLTGWVLLLVVLMTTVAASLAVSSFPRSILRAWCRKLRGFANDR
jgi:hypothetical protein